MTLAPDGTAGAQSNVVQTMSLSAEPASSSSGSGSHGNSAHSVMASNDNGSSSHRTAWTAGESAALMASFAAVGLEIEHAKLDLHIPAGGMHAPSMAPLASAASVAGAAGGSSSAAAAPTHVVESAAVAASTHAPQAASHAHDMSPLAHGLGQSDGVHAPSVAELLHGTAPVAHAPASSPSPVMAPAVAMPSAHQLEAAAAAHAPAQGQPQASVAPEAQHNEVVSKVLADALHGGDAHGPSIDHLVDSLSGHHGGGSSAIAALASHGMANVPAGDMGFQMAFGSPHVVPMEEAMHVAAPAHG